MASLIPVATWGLQVGTNDDPEPAFTFGEMPATLRITMAALDPGENWEANNGSSDYKDKKPRATLKMITIEEPEDEDDETDPSMASLLDESDESSEDEDSNGAGPSDPEKAKKHLTNGINGIMTNGIKKKDSKGKGKATDASSDMSEDDEDDDDSSEGESAVNEYVLCTLDPDNHYQQTLDITIPEDEQVLFRVEGTHSVYLTGNIVVDPSAGPYDEDEYDSENEDVDLSPGEDELDYFDDEDESDALDDTADPRIMEVDSDDLEEAEVPKLVKKEVAAAVAGSKKGANADKGKNKRAAPEDSDVSMTEPDAKATSIDDLLAKSLKTELPTAGDGDKPLSNKQKKKLNKKLKDNAGNAVDVAANDKTGTKETAVDSKSSPASGKSDKHVQFAKTLVQGPSGGEAKSAEPEADKKIDSSKSTPKASLGIKVVDGVTIDDKKLGSGRTAKKGDKVSMRYIGKLETTKAVFDSNKKGAPFSFKLGTGQVIKGWDIGVAGMAMGGERRITVPAPLAYGSKKMGDSIPANSTLVFDLKVLDIKP